MASDETPIVVGHGHEAITITHEKVIRPDGEALVEAYVARRSSGEQVGINLRKNPLLDDLRSLWQVRGGGLKQL